VDDETRAIVEAVREHLAAEVAPRAEKIDAAGEFPKAEFAGLAGLGIPGMLVPSEQGGAGLRPPAAAAVVETIATACPALAWVAAAHATAGHAVAVASGDSEGGARIAQEHLEGLVGGEVIGTVGTEEKDGSFIAPGGAGAAVALLLPRTSAGAKSIVRIGEKGASAEPIGPGLGLRAAPLARIMRRAEDGGIPTDSTGKVRHHRALFRTLVGAQAVGVARAALAETLEYTRQRKQFGRAIGSFQPLKWYLAEMSTDIDAAAELVARAAEETESSPHPLRIASEAKLFATDMLARHARKVVQMHGGYGFDAGTLPERVYRDAKAYELLGGANQDLRDEIAGLL
jgi:alkylation response protein AidB-like acyl-CoA dehydrogenase